MKLLIDNALSPMVAKKLNEAGYDAVHVRDLGLQAAPDTVLLGTAEKDDRTIVSADTDFGTLLTLRDRRKPSFILIRRQHDVTPTKMAAFLIDTLPGLEDDLQRGAVVVVTDERMRIRRLPVRRGEND
jgi:predicted nuclease of predicted toxin-antitoxin system